MQTVDAAVIPTYVQVLQVLFKFGLDEKQECISDQRVLGASEIDR